MQHMPVMRWGGRGAGGAMASNRLEASEKDAPQQPELWASNPHTSDLSKGLYVCTLAQQVWIHRTLKYEFGGRHVWIIKFLTSIVC